MEEGGFKYRVENRGAVVTGYTGDDDRISIPDELDSFPVEGIGEEAFSLCHSLEAVELPDGLRSIGDHAFYMCRSLESVELSDGLRSIGDYAFSHCDGLESVEVPESVEFIGDYAFHSCESLESIRVDPDNPRYASIDGVLFDKVAKSLLQYPPGRPADSYTVPEGIKAIATSAFESCSSLQSVELPSSLESIAGGAFQGCLFMGSIEVDPDNATYAIVDGALVDMSRNALVCLPPALGASSYAVPDFVVAIEPYAFSSCDSLESVKLPPSLEMIGNSAFDGCGKLMKVVIPSSVTSIGDRAFSSCDSLESVEVPESVEYIGYKAFPENPGFFLKVAKGSYAQEWASDMGVPYIFSDQTDWLTA